MSIHEGDVDGPPLLQRADLEPITSHLNPCPPTTTTTTITNIIIITAQNNYHEDDIKNIKDVLQIEYSTAAIVFATIMDLTRWRRKVHLPSRLLTTLHHGSYNADRKINVKQLRQEFRVDHCISTLMEFAIILPPGLPLTSSFLLEYSSEYLSEYSSTR